MAEDKQGSPMWVESCMTQQEYKEYCKKYPNVTNPPMHKVAHFNDPKHLKWRWKMGAAMTPEDVEKSNKNRDKLIKTLKELYVLRNSGECIQGAP